MVVIVVDLGDQSELGKERRGSMMFLSAVFGSSATGCWHCYSGSVGRARCAKCLE